MQAILIAAIAAVGVDVGWQPAESGETEYIIQIEPHQLKTLKPGDKIDVGVRPQLRKIRSFQIVVGDGQLPRIQQAPKLSLTSPDDRALDPAAAGTPFVANRYPDLVLPDNQSTGNNSSRNVVLPRPDQESPASDTRWSGRDNQVTWPMRPAAGNVRPSSPERSNPITERRAATAVDGRSTQPRLQPRKNLQVTQPRVPDTNPQTPLNDAQRRLIDIGESVIPREPRRVTNGTTTPDAGLSVPRESRQTDRERAVPRRSLTAPDFRAPSSGLTTADNPPARPAKAAVGPRYAQPEPTLPRLPADTNGPSPNGAIVLPQTVAPDKSHSLEKVRREMARSLENRTRPQPLASDTGPAAFQIQPGQAPTAVTKSPRVAAATVTSVPVKPATPTTSATPTAPAAPAAPTEKNAVPQPTPANPALAISRPWLPLTLSLLALFASLGGNLYLGWMTLDLRRRFRYFARGLRFHEDDRRSNSLASVTRGDYD